jgi:trigger factor
MRSCSAPVAMRAQQFPGQEREVIEFFQKNPQQLAGVRAPIFEDKVIDFILELGQRDRQECRSVRTGR